MGIRKAVLLFWLLGFMSLVFITGVNGELPPGSYDELKAGAEEKLIIKIMNIEKEVQDERRISLTYTAEVVVVLRSMSDLKPGDIININSYRWTGSYKGPVNPPLLSVGWIGAAYLNGSESSYQENVKTYSLAAYGASFE